MKNQIRTAAFWAGILFGIAAGIQALLSSYGIGFPEGAADKIITSILTLLSISGIITGKINPDGSSETDGSIPDENIPDIFDKIPETDGIELKKDKETKNNNKII